MAQPRERKNASAPPPGDEADDKPWFWSKPGFQVWRFNAPTSLIAGFRCSTPGMLLRTGSCEYVASHCRLLLSRLARLVGHLCLAAVLSRLVLRYRHLCRQGSCALFALS